MTIGVCVRNSGERAGEEVVQVYLADVESSVTTPVRKLVGFTRIALDAGEKREVSFTITPDQMAVVNDDGERVLEPGEFGVTIGGSQGDARSIALGAVPPVRARFRVAGPDD